MALAYWYVPLILLGAAIVVGIAAWWTTRRRVARPGTGVPVANSERLTSLPAYRRVLGRTTALASVTAVVLVALLVVTSVAAGRWIYQRIEQPEKYNRDIVLCLDVSGSMVDFDVEVVDRYLEMLPGFSGERMALVLWNSTAVPIFPLTDDYGFVKEQLEEVRTGMSGGYGSYVYGTEGQSGASLVGDGLASCALMFDGQDDDGRSRSIIFATDNAINGEPIVSLPDAAAYAASKQIKVYGLDANEFQDAYSDEFRTSMARNGGQYYKLTDPQSVSGIVDQITTDQTSVVLGAPQVLITDRPASWLFSMLIGVALLIGLAWRLRL